MTTDPSRTAELARTILAAWTRQDVAGVLAHYTEDLVYADPNTKGPVRGRAAFARYLERLFSEWVMTWTLREAHPIDDGAGAQILWTGTFRRKAGGPTAEIDGMDLVVLAGDRIARNEVQFDRARLPGAVGAATDPEQHRLVVKSWLTHDAMWLRAAIEELGVERANRLNLRAVRDAARIEAKRVLGVMGIERIATLEQLDAFLHRARALFVGDALSADWTLEPPDVLRFRVGECFAQKGMARLGLLSRYECGIYERMWGWLDGLGVGHEHSPATRACTKEEESHCARTVRLTFADSGAPAE